MQKQLQRIRLRNCLFCWRCCRELWEICCQLRFVVLNNPQPQHHNTATPQHHDTATPRHHNTATSHSQGRNRQETGRGGVAATSCPPAEASPRPRWRVRDKQISWSWFLPHQRRPRPAGAVWPLCLPAKPKGRVSAHRRWNPCVSTGPRRPPDPRPLTSANPGLGCRNQLRSVWKPQRRQTGFLTSNYRCVTPSPAFWRGHGRGGGAAANLLASATITR